MLYTFLTAIFASAGITPWGQRNTSEIAPDLSKLVSSNDNNLRLPSNTVPDLYDLQLKLYLPGYVNFSSTKINVIEGRVKIRIRIITETSLITLNSQNLRYNATNSSRLFVIKNNVLSTEIKILNVWVQNENDWVHIQAERRLYPGEIFELQIQYTGMLTDDLGGLYLTSYKNDNGTLKYAVATNFMPIYARMAIPCYDEPAVKVPWKVKVSHPKGTQALSNQKQEKTEKDPEDANFMLTSFLQTPNMSSYLLSISVSEFTTSIKTDQITYSIITRKESQNMTQLALETVIKCTKFYETYFGVKYPLPKMDILGIPDSPYGAMENWGLISYKEASLLYSPKLYDGIDRLKMTGLITHELAHQWFGNLVTMDWWNDVFLSEGFANLVQTLGTDSLHNGAYKALDYFLTTSFRNGLEVDSQTESHPLAFKVQTKSDILGVYDTIAYDKGSSVLAMIRYLIGSDIFLKGIKNYLTKYSYRSAKAFDLISELDAVVPVNITGPNGDRLNLTKLIPQWIYQKGYPYITLEHTSNTEMRLTQSRYLVGGVDPEPSPYGYKWDIPVWIQRGRSQPTLEWLIKERPLILTDRNAQVTIVNAEAFAFIRQNYGQRNWQMLATQMIADHLMFSNRTRYAIVSDAFAMAGIGKLDYDTLFDMMNYIKNETSYLPLNAFEFEFGKLIDHFEVNSDVYINAQRYHISLLYDKYSSFLPTSIQQNYLDDWKVYDSARDTLIYNTYCSLTGNCTEMRTIYQQQVAAPCSSGKNPIMSSFCATVVPPIRRAVYCNEVKNNDSAFNTILEFYQRENVYKEKDNLLSALACTKNMGNLYWLLNTATNRSSQVIRLQDVTTVFSDVSMNQMGATLLVDYLLNNWNRLYYQFSMQQIILNSIVDICLSQAKSMNDINKVISFMATASNIQNYDAFPKQLSLARQKVDWLNRNTDTLRRIFLKFNH